MTSPPSPHPKQYQAPLAGLIVERRAALVVERAEPLQAAAAGRLERDVVAHDLVDPGPLAHEDDVLVTDPASHVVILRTTSNRHPGSVLGRRCARPGGSVRGVADS